MTESQQPLIGEASVHKPRTVRKTRIDKGVRRKPDPTEREAWRQFFRDLPAAEKTFELGYLTAITEVEDNRLVIAGQQPSSLIKLLSDEKNSGQ